MCWRFTQQTVIQFNLICFYVSLHNKQVIFFLDLLSESGNEILNMFCLNVYWPVQIIIPEQKILILNNLEHLPIYLLLSKIEDQLRILTDYYLNLNERCKTFVMFWKRRRKICMVLTQYWRKNVILPSSTRSFEFVKLEKSLP